MGGVNILFRDKARVGAEKGGGAGTGSRIECNQDVGVRRGRWVAI